MRTPLETTESAIAIDITAIIKGRLDLIDNIHRLLITAKPAVHTGEIIIILRTLREFQRRLMQVDMKEIQSLETAVDRALLEADASPKDYQ